MVVIYEFDPQKKNLIGSQVVNSNRKLKDNETIVAPDFQNTFAPYTWMGDHWSGQTQAEFAKAKGTGTPQMPSASQEMMMQLSQNVTTLQSMVMAQNQQLAQLMVKEEK